jgi:glycosyltransferase involved in cell wall biosynthesis
MAKKRNRKLKIAIFQTHYPEILQTDSKGLGESIQGLAWSLRKNSVDVTIISTTKNNEPTKEVKDECGTKVLKFQIQKSINPFQIPAKIKEHFERNGKKYDFVLLNVQFNTLNYSLSKFLSKLNIKYIFIPHNQYNEYIFGRNTLLKLSYWFLFERRLIKRAFGIYFQSKFHKKYLNGLNENVIVAPNGFIPYQIKTAKKRISNIDSSTKLISLCRLDLYNKGLDLLIKAISKLHPRYKIVLTLQGRDYGDKKILLALINKLRCDQFVRIIDPDFTENAVEIIGAHDIFVLTSRYEGFSMGALHAMLAERPVIITRIAGISEHIEKAKAGFIIEEPTVESITKTLKLALKNKHKWKEMGKRGRKYAFKNLTWEKIGKSVKEQYIDLLRNKSK